MITVPTDFSNTLKAALVAPAKDSELEVVQIISEPVAGVLAYAARQAPQEPGVSKNILVAVLGGTRCEAPVIVSGVGRPLLRSLTTTDLAG